MKIQTFFPQIEIQCDIENVTFLSSYLTTNQKCKNSFDITLQFSCVVLFALRVIYQQGKYKKCTDYVKVAEEFFSKEFGEN